MAYSIEAKCLGYDFVSFYRSLLAFFFHLSILNSYALAQEQFEAFDPQLSLAEIEDLVDEITANEQEQIQEHSSEFPSYESEEGEFSSAESLDFFSNGVGLENKHSVIFPDERKAVSETRIFPASAIAQITFRKKNGKKSLCSGAMISQNLLLTAAHCIHSGTVDGYYYGKHQVYPGKNLLFVPFGKCGVKSVFVLPGWKEAKSNFEAMFHDLGVLKLDCEVGQRTGWFGLDTGAESYLGKLSRVQGYAKNKLPGRQSYSVNKFEKIEMGKGFYQNDVSGGQSGSPVTSSNQAVIIGVHTNGIFSSTEPYSTHNAFTTINSEIYKQIEEFKGTAED